MGTRIQANRIRALPRLWDVVQKVALGKIGIVAATVLCVLSVVWLVSAMPDVTTLLLLLLLPVAGLLASTIYVHFKRMAADQLVSIDGDLRFLMKVNRPAYPAWARGLASASAMVGGSIIMILTLVVFADHYQRPDSSRQARQPPAVVEKPQGENASYAGSNREVHSLSHWSLQHELVANTQSLDNHTQPRTKAMGLSERDRRTHLGSGEGSGVQAREYAAQIPQVQRQLKEAGFDPGPIDGVLGPRTRMALRKYQAYYGLPETGLVDEPTGHSLGLQRIP